MASTLLTLSALGLAAAWHHCCFHLVSGNEVGLLATDQARPITVRGWVASRSEVIQEECLNKMDRLPRSSRTRFDFRVESYRTEKGWKTVSGKVRVSIEGASPDLWTGDRIELAGWLTRPKVGKSKLDFDRRSYLRAYGIHSLLYVADSSSVKDRQGIRPLSWPMRFFDLVADRLSKRMVYLFSPSHAPFFQAVLLGERHQIESDWRQLFIQSGTIHLLAISGMHLAILCSGWLFLIRHGLLPRRIGYLATMAFAISYCLLTGARPPVTRATILIVVYCWSKMVGKKVVPTNTLCLAGLIVVLIWPAGIFLPGPQLSFVAVAFLLMYSEWSRQTDEDLDELDRFLLRKRSRVQKLHGWLTSALGGALKTSLGIWLATLPMVANCFHVVAPIGILANVLLILPITLVLNFSLTTLVLSGVNMGWPFSQFAEWILAIVQTIVMVSAKLPGACWWTCGFGATPLCIFYGAFLAIFLFPPFRPNRGRSLILAVTWLSLACLANELDGRSKDSTSVTFIDVDHGNSVLLEFPNGKSVLYDAGSLLSSDLAVRRISAVLWEQKIFRLEAIVISHADLDHFNAIPGLLERFPVNRFIITPQTRSKLRQTVGQPDSPLKRLAQTLNDQPVEVNEVNSNVRLNFDPSCKVVVLHPGPAFSGDNDNANSLVLWLESRGHSILLTGDLELNGLKELCKQVPPSVDILMAPHHGSVTADHEQILSWSQPDQVVISCGPFKLDPDIRCRYSRQNLPVLVTGEKGAISFHLGADSLRCTAFLDNFSHPNR